MTFYFMLHLNKYVLYQNERIIFSFHRLTKFSLSFMKGFTYYTCTLEGGHQVKKNTRLSGKILITYIKQICNFDK